MYKFYKLALAFIAVLVILQGCGSNTEEEQIVDDNSTIELNVTILVKGDEPLIGTSGLKKLILIEDANEFAILWSDYTNETLPTIDFNKQVVALYDMGGDRYRYSEIILTSVSAKKIDNSISKIKVTLTKKCPYIVNDTVEVSDDIMAGFIRPFIFVSIQKSKETLMSEEIVFEICE